MKREWATSRSLMDSLDNDMATLDGVVADLLVASNDSLEVRGYALLRSVCYAAETFNFLTCFKSTF